MLCKFNCNTLGWKSVLFIFIYIQFAYVSVIDQQCVYICSCTGSMVPFPT